MRGNRPTEFGRCGSLMTTFANPCTVESCGDVTKGRLRRGGGGVRRRRRRCGGGAKSRPPPSFHLIQLSSPRLVHIVRVEFFSQALHNANVALKPAHGNTSHVITVSRLHDCKKNKQRPIAHSLIIMKYGKVTRVLSHNLNCRDRCGLVITFCEEHFMPVPYVFWLLLCCFMYIIAINIRILKFQRWLLLHV